MKDFEYYLEISMQHNIELAKKYAPESELAKIEDKQETIKKIYNLIYAKKGLESSEAMKIAEQIYELMDKK